MPQPPVTPPQEEDELDPLPPLDGEDRDPAAAPDAEDGFGELLEDDGGEASLDDATAEDEPADAGELEVNDEDGGWLDEPADAPDLDLGEVAVVEFGDDAPVLEDTDEPSSPVRDEDFGFGAAPERGDLDAGDEGPLDPDEDLDERDLPALDADDEGDVEDAALLDAGFAGDEPLGLPWAAEPWSRVGPPVGLSAATGVACADRGAVVAGRWPDGAAELVRVDLEGTWQALPALGLDPGEVRALSADRDLVAAVVDGGALLVSRDGGASFGPLPGAVAGIGALAAVDVAIAAGHVASDAARDAARDLWVRTRGGGLLFARADGAAIERCPVAGTVAAITREAAGGVAALVLDANGRPIALERGAPGGTLTRETFDGPEPHTCAPLAVRGRHAAYAGRRGGVVRRLDCGAWTPIAWEGRVTALAFIDDSGTLVAATSSDADDTTALVRVDAQGRSSVVARMGPARADTEADGQVLSMAYDDARAVVWVAGGVGVAAFAAR